MVRGETRCQPVSLETSRVLNYWFKLFNCSKENKLSNFTYNYMLSLFTSGEYVHHGFIRRKLHYGYTWVKTDTIDTCDTAVLCDVSSDTVVFLTSDTIHKNKITLRLCEASTNLKYGSIFEEFIVYFYS